MLLREARCQLKPEKAQNKSSSKLFHMRNKISQWGTRKQHGTKIYLLHHSYQIILHTCVIIPFDNTCVSAYSFISWNLEEIFKKQYRSTNRKTQQNLPKLGKIFSKTWKNLAHESVTSATTWLPASPPYHHRFSLKWMSKPGGQSPKPGGQSKKLGGRERNQTGHVHNLS